MLKKKNSPTSVHSEFCKISKNTFFRRTSAKSCFWILLQCKLKQGYYSTLLRGASREIIGYPPQYSQSLFRNLQEQKQPVEMSFRPATLLKRDSNTGVFRNTYFEEHLRTTAFERSMKTICPNF